MFVTLNLRIQRLVGDGKVTLSIVPVIDSCLMLEVLLSILGLQTNLLTEGVVSYPVRLLPENQLQPTTS